MTDQKTLERVWTMMDDIKVCMMTSRDGQNLRSRPMHAMPRRDDELVYFFTDVHAHKDDEFKQEPHCNLGFADKDDHTFVSVSGTIEVLNDLVLAKKLWNKDADAWFPDGPDSPNLRTLRFTPEFGEFWTGPSNSIVAKAKIAMARVRGTPPDMGEDKKVSFA